MRKILIICLLIISASKVFADVVASENALKAAFIFHFISFTEWNNNHSDYFVCIPDDPELRETARESFKGKLVNNHSIVVSNQIEGCQILVSKNPPASETTMTIGRLDDGAMFEFRLINNKMKFAVDLTKVKNFKFKISSQLLKLAILKNGGTI